MSEQTEKKTSADQGAGAEAAPAAAASKDVLASILSEETIQKVESAYKPRTDSQRDQMTRMLEVFVSQAAEGHIQRTQALEESLDRAIARLDGLLTAQLNPILHHPEFQKVEASWRGLHYLVQQSETSETLKLRVLDVNKKDLMDDLSKASDFDQSGLFKMVYEGEFGMPGGTPYGALIGDYYFGNNDPDLALIEKISQVAAAAHAPFFAGADPSVFGFDSFTELMDPRDLSKKFEGADFARWRSLRKRPESVYVGLTLPHTLGRLPYGEKTDPVGAFRFEEEASGETHQNYLWTNSSWAFGSRLTDAFAKYGWCTAICGRELGGTVAGLPVHTFPTDEGTIDAKCPTEIAITERRDAELDKLGFVPLCHYKNTDYAVFFAAQSVNKPDEYQEAWATANADLMSQIPYVMAVSRFAHYLKVMQRDKLGSFRERDEVEKELQDWIANYVLLNPEKAGDELKAQKPLSAAQVTVHDVAGKPGHFRATFLLRPHFMLRKIDVSLRLVAQLDQPSK